MAKFFATFPKTKEYAIIEEDNLSDAYCRMFKDFGYNWGLLYSEREGLDISNLTLK